MYAQGCGWYDDPRGSAVVNRAWCKFLKWFHPLQPIGGGRARLGFPHGAKVPFTESHSFANKCPMDNLITVVTRFQLPAGITADQILCV